MSLTFVDLFCGAGGSSLGLTEAGLSLQLAANHWDRAIATHAANFPDADHLCADLDRYDMRRLPPARVLWASPICREGSPAGGTAKARGTLRPGEMWLMDDGEREEYLAALNKGWERTRATAYDVLRAAEIWGYDAILIENVIEFARDWPLFNWWLEAFTRLGYAHRIVCVNSAHIWGPYNPPAPQWRDRLYIVFLRADATMPDLEPRPPAWCPTCGQDVAARQTWKTHTPGGKARLGKYRQQYTYTCPNTSRRHQSWTVEPYILPAAAAINWDDLGTRIGDRKSPLAAETMRRIRNGARAARNRPVMLQINHAGHDGRAYPAHAAPLTARAVRGGDGFATPPLLVPAGGTWNHTPTTAAEPMRTRTANPKGMEALACPPHQSGPHSAEPYVVEMRGGGSTSRPVSHPLATLTAGGNHHGLVVPYRTGNRVTTTAEPLHTVATIDSAALVQGAAPPIADWTFRMLRAREHLRAQRFPDTYTVTGTAGEQTMQAGNAVSANVAHWLGTKLMEALG
ncbi:DNA cytosine methyltransferase [Actinomadura sp. NBRC 104412]|uniref:DNA cytosine methyltransferase n=1 Tax=Actinomadura sp. NBRC 104412 TaxID=3032203 RepID=UPI0024A17CCA|nr:DNA cytosine methyltransferase [Actinomadura sp. NBRC 104412]GLZ09609.1 DNA cytosine methyltransferase [Actinomadura sp. NBRC 104412]